MAKKEKTSKVGKKIAPKLLKGKKLPEKTKSAPDKKKKKK
jgi:hypothetical protein